MATSRATCALTRWNRPLPCNWAAANSADLAHCAKLRRKLGLRRVNLNVGCPSEQVQRGAFGACLMNKAALVADCVKTMRDAVSIPVTVKHRIGVDQIEHYGFLAEFGDTVAAAGCTTFIVHARNAILKGLSPRKTGKSRR